MRFSCLASGSSGNCFYIENKGKAILIDAGLSCKETIIRLNEQGLDEKKIEAIFVTHEHTDHIRGVDRLARLTQAKIYATKGTIKNSFLCSQESLIQELKPNKTIDIGELEITAMDKSHDAEEPVFFQIKNNKTLSIITDAGFACKNIKRAVNASDFIVMEANHDITMLENGPYPYFLKKRILSDKGHLSNLHSALCILEHSSSQLKKIFLAHLSKTNNTPAIASRTFKDILKERKDLTPEIVLTKQDEVTRLVNLQ